MQEMEQAILRDSGKHLKSILKGLTLLSSQTKKKNIKFISINPGDLEILQLSLRSYWDCIDENDNPIRCFQCNSKERIACFIELFDDFRHSETMKEYYKEQYTFGVEFDEFQADLNNTVKNMFITLEKRTIPDLIESHLVGILTKLNNFINNRR